MSTNDNNELNVFTVNDLTYITRFKDNHNLITNIVTPNGKTISRLSEIYDSEFLIFEHDFDPVSDKIVTIQKVKNPAEVFISRDSDKKIKSPINQEVYDKLPDSLKTLYVQNIENKEIINNIDDYNFINIVEYNKKLDKKIYYTRNDVLNNIEKFNYKNNKRAKISRSSLLYSYDKDPFDSLSSYITVEFFKNDYNGETKKIYDKKKNGGIYSDKRGKLVPEYPEVIDTIMIIGEDIPFFNANNQEEMNQKMQDYADFITMTSSLPK